MLATGDTSFVTIDAGAASRIDIELFDETVIEVDALEARRSNSIAHSVRDVVSC
jgi:hypothetical protein